MSRPGTRQSRPGTRQGIQGSPTSTTGELDQDGRPRWPGNRAQSPRWSPSQERCSQEMTDSDMEAKVAVFWPDYQWPSSASGKPAGDAAVPFSSQSTRSPQSTRRMLMSADDPCSTTSTMGTMDSWKRAIISRDGPLLQTQSSGTGYPDNVRGAPPKVHGQQSRSQQGWTGKLPQMGEDARRIQTAIGSSRQQPRQDQSVVDTPRGLAGLCSTLEKQVAMGLHGNRQESQSKPSTAGSRLGKLSSSGARSARGNISMGRDFKRQPQNIL